MGLPSELPHGPACYNVAAGTWILCALTVRKALLEKSSRAIVGRLHGKLYQNEGQKTSPYNKRPRTVSPGAFVVSSCTAVWDVLGSKNDGLMGASLRESSVWRKDYKAIWFLLPLKYLLFLQNLFENEDRNIFSALYQASAKLVHISFPVLRY